MTILTRDQMVQSILDALEEATQDYEPEERGEAQAHILAAFFGGIVKRKSNGYWK